MACGDVDGVSRLSIVVDATERPQMSGVEALDAEQQQDDAGRAKAGEFPGCNGSRIGFERDLGTGQEGQTATQCGQELIEAGSREQTGCAATGKKALCTRRPQTSGSADSQVGDQRGEIVALGDRRLPGMRIEVTVGAFPHAPGHMHVQR